MDGWGISFPFVPDWKIKRFQPLLLTKSEFIKQKIKSSSMEETDYSLVRSAHTGLKRSNFWVWGIIQKRIHSGNPDSSTKVLCRLNKAPLCSVRALCYRLQPHVRLSVLTGPAKAKTELHDWTLPDKIHYWYRLPNILLFAVWSETWWSKAEQMLLAVTFDNSLSHLC